MGHVHFVVQDLDAGKQFWTAMGGVPGKLGANDVYKFPGVLILLRKGDATAASVGSVVGHIGFHVPDTAAAMARWKAAGLKTEAGANPGQGFVWTPDNLLRVEILEDKTQTVPIAFHHVHFYVADSAALPMCWRCNPGTSRCSGPSPGSAANSTPRICRE
jgi:catechol 2,3-dioxygenase-like lactoylglutathione lyase family enzyme